MKIKRALISKITLLILMFMVILVYNGCKKEQSDNHPDPSVLNTNQVRELFYTKGLDKKLVNKINDTAEVIWTPAWEKVFSKIKDSVNYLYVPLVPQLRNSKGTGQVITTNQRQFLIVKDGKDFLRATYVQDESAKKGQSALSMQFTHFNGSLILNNLGTAQSFIYQYKNGAGTRAVAGPGVISASRSGSNPGTTIMGYRTECYTDYVCTWYAYCGSSIYIYTNLNGCNYPPNSPGDFGNCSDDYWYLSYSEPTEVCEDVYFPDLPPEPGNGNDGTDSISESDLEHATVAEDELKKIENIDKYMECFNDGKTAAFYELTLYVDQPVAGTDRQTNITGVELVGNLTLVMDGTSFDVGHTFVGFRKVNTDGTKVEQVLGFYPERTSPYDKGVIKDNSGHAYDVSYTVDVSSIEFTSALAQMKNDADNENYLVNSYNCTDAALLWMNAADAGLAGAPRGVFSNTPGDYGQALRAKSDANKTGGVAPNSKGPCN